MRRWVSIFAALTLAAFPARAADVYRLAGVENPPYLGRDLPDGGSVGGLVARAFAAMGARVEIDFLPPARAERVGVSSADHVGYLTEFRSPDVERKCALSAPVGHSAAALVERSDRHFTWSSLDDLRGSIIGVVEGRAVDGAEFDKAVEEGAIKVERARDDLTVLRLVAGDRTPLGVVDVNVLHALVEAHPELDGRLWVVPRPLADRDLLVCFRDDQTGRAARDLLNAGLAKLDLGRADERAEAHLALGS